MKLIARIFVIAGLLAIATPVGPVGAAGRPLTADLSGVNEVPSNFLGATGTANVTINQGQGEICLDLSTTNLLSPVLAGHIHEAPAGVNGPVVINLGVNDAQFNGCVEAPADLLKEIRKNPGDYYVNIHTVSVPSGELRGQLSK